jgi:hypothetical protein
VVQKLSGAQDPLETAASLIGKHLSDKRVTKEEMIHVS